MKQILIYSPKCTQRMEYVFRHLFINLGLSYQIVQDRILFLAHPGPKINYSSCRLSEEELFVPYSGFLEQSRLSRPSLDLKMQSGLPAFFVFPGLSEEINYDILACIFFFLSRYEEYLPFQPDRLGRFTAAMSVAAQNNLLHRPVVDEWTDYFLDCLARRFLNIRIDRPVFHYTPTYDIDQAWAFKSKPIWRNLAGGGMELLKGQWRPFGQRWRVITGVDPDPFDQYVFLNQLHEQYNLKATFFFLVGDYGPFDKNIPVKHQAMQQLIRQIGTNNTVGLHPSFRSNQTHRILLKEVSKLCGVLNTQVLYSRQHFLLLTLPHTYRRLIEIGIEADFSMGFADSTGFRAGTARPFTWYDLTAEIISGLTIHPFQVMDVTLKNYMKLTPEEAVEHCKALMGTIKKQGGNFSTLWHNSSLSYLDGWAEWKNVYQKIFEMAVQP